MKYIIYFTPIIIWLIAFWFGFNFDSEIYVSNKTEIYTHKTTYEILYNLLRNNISIVVINSLSFITFSLYSSFSIGVNGFIFGILIGKSLKANISLFSILLNVLPHGIFEISGLWLSGITSIYGTEIFIKYIKNNTFSRKTIVYYLKLFIISLLLTLISVFIETFFVISKFL